MHTCGGRVSIVVNGLRYSARGELTLNPSRINVDVGANQDGTLYKTVKPQPAMAECTFDSFVDNFGTPLKWSDDLLLLNNIAATFVEQDTGTTHLLSNASFVGEPGFNTATGEVSGLRIAAEKYETIR